MGLPEALGEGVAVTHVVLEQAWCRCREEGDESTKKLVSADSLLLGQFSNPELASQHNWVLMTPWATLLFESLGNQDITSSLQFQELTNKLWPDPAAMKGKMNISSY